MVSSSCGIISIICFLFLLAGCQAKPSENKASSITVPKKKECAADGIDPVFKPAIADICGLAAFPILLPPKLPAEFEGIKTAQGKIQGEGYQIALYDDLEAGNAGYAGSFGASKDGINGVPNTQAVNLNDGSPGVFRSVSCGGSCAPASLWWEKDGITYQIQLVMDPKTDEARQLRVLLQIANSSIAVK
jgi:hypothetical protein